MCIFIKLYRHIRSAFEPKPTKYIRRFRYNPFPDLGKSQYNPRRKGKPEVDFSMYYKTLEARAETFKHFVKDYKTDFNTFNTYEFLLLLKNDNFSKLKNLTKKDFSPLFKACSYYKFLYSYYDCCISTKNKINVTKTAKFNKFFKNQAIKQKEITKKILKYRQKFLKDWQLEILDNIKVYTFSDVDRFKPLDYKWIQYAKMRYKPITGNFVDLNFYENIAQNIKERYKDWVKLIIQTEVDIIRSYDKPFYPYNENTYRTIEEKQNVEADDKQIYMLKRGCRKGRRYKERWVRFKIINLTDLIKPYIKPIKTIRITPKKSILFEKNIIQSLSSLSKGTFERGQLNDDIFNSYTESILFKLYTRRKNYSSFKLKFNKEKVKKLRKKTSKSLLKNSYSQEFFRKYYRSWYKKLPDRNIYCFLSKNDILNILFKRQKVQPGFGYYAPPGKILETNLGYFYRKVNLDKDKEKFDEFIRDAKFRDSIDINKHLEKTPELFLKNKKNLLIIPPLENIKNYSSLKNIKENKDVFTDLCYIKIYLLDLSDDLPFLKVGDQASLKEVYFYPFKNKNKKTNLYLPYAFNKNEIVLLYNKIKENEIYYKNLIKNKNINLNSGVKVIEIDLKEFFEITKGFSLKNRKIVPINLKNL